MAYRPLDQDRLLDRVRRAAAGWRTGAVVSDLQAMHGGASGLTFAVQLTVDEVRQPAVLKVAPAGLEPVRNRDVLRQAAVQRALAGLDGFPVPEILFMTPGDGLDDPPFYAMRRVEGECYEPLLDLAEPTSDVSVYNARAVALLGGMARLHRVGVAELSARTGVPPISLVEEVETWRRAIATVDAGAIGHDGARLAIEAGRRLLDQLPTDGPGQQALVHGDLRLGNALFQESVLGAVIDWEICRVGHPLLDLAWMCSFLDPSNLVTRARDLPGLIAPNELATHYAELTGFPIDDLDWFSGLVCFKQAAATALIVKNNLRRPDPDPHLVTLGPKVAAYLERVISLVPASTTALTHHK